MIRYWLICCLLLVLPNFVGDLRGGEIKACDEAKACDESAVGDDDKFVPMFNGKDFSGWVRTNTPESTWAYQDGMIVCSGKPIGEIRTEQMYQNFILELEWRHMVPAGNAGIFLFADDITARGVPFHRGIEVQVLDNAYGNTLHYSTHGDIFPIHGAKMVPVNGRGGDRAFPTENRSNPSPQWNHYRITANDGDVTLAVNGKVVTQGKQCSPSKGYICLESEGGVVHYRNIRIQVLPDTPIDSADVAVANRGFYSIYSGLDLGGWRTSAEVQQRWHSRDWVLAYEGSDTDPPLVYEQPVKNFGFVIDFKLNKPDAAFTLQLLGEPNDGADSADPLSIYSSASQDEPLVPAGQWNRLEGALVGSELTLAVNGIALPNKFLQAGLPSSRRIVLAPKGQVDFANLYLREINAAKSDENNGDASADK